MSLKKDILWLGRRDNWKCHWCGCDVYQKVGQRMARNTATRDHLIPRSVGGTNAQANQVLSCYTCNGTRGNIPADIWRRAMDEALRDCPEGIHPAAWAFRVAKRYRRTSEHIQERLARERWPYPNGP